MKRLGSLLGVCIVALCAAPARAQGDRVEAPIAPGVTYLRLTRPGPVVIHVLRADLAEPTLRLGVATAGKQVLDAEPLAELVAHQTGRTVAGALNGGHAVTGSDPYQGNPIGLLIADGELLCDPWPTQRSALLIGADGRPRIEVIGLRGKVTGADGKVQRLGGLNRRRLPGEMVLYTPRFNPATRILEGGQQLVLTGVFGDNGKLIAGRVYKGHVEALVDGRVNVEIPRDGAVIAGSGPAAAWLSERKLGEDVTFTYELVPDPGPVAAALGAGPRLVRDGRISIEAEAEKLGVSTTIGRQPRSAVGFNDKSFFLVAADGRNPEASVGLDINELARLLVELGATQAMELEGGGATTLYVRDRVINQPSDGVQRPLADAVAIYTAGKLSDAPLPSATLIADGNATPPTPVEPVKPTTPGATPGATTVATGPAPMATTPPAGAPTGRGVPTRIRFAADEITLAPGETCQLTLVAENDEGEQVPLRLDQVRFEGGGAHGTIDPQGRFTAKHAGIGRITAWYGELSAAVVYKVTLGAAPVPPGTGTGGPQPTLVEPGGTKPTTPKPTTPPKPTAPPKPTTPPKPEPPAGERVPPKLPEGTRMQIDGFEQQRNWRPVLFPQDVGGDILITDNNIRKQGTHCAKLSYDFTKTAKPGAVYAVYDSPIGLPKAVSVWVFGDGKGQSLKGHLRDQTGKQYTVEFVERIKWDHAWWRCSALLPEGLQGPVIWESFILAQNGPEKTAGAIYLDQFEGIY